MHRRRFDEILEVSPAVDWWQKRKWSWENQLRHSAG